MGEVSAMNRRGFLRSFVAGAPALVIPSWLAEELDPMRRRIFLPSRVKLEVVDEAFTPILPERLMFTGTSSYDEEVEVNLVSYGSVVELDPQGLRCHQRSEIRMSRRWELPCYTERGDICAADVDLDLEEHLEIAIAVG